MNMEYFAGIDIGSLSTEAVIINEKEEILAYSIRETGYDPSSAAQKALEEAMGKCGLGEDSLKFIVATGYGRISIPFADKKVTEISCHAVGAHCLFPETETVIDIGGQDSKVIHVGQGGKVLDFAMNDKCAAGTGRFLEIMAATFKLSMEQFAEQALNSAQSMPISSVCTVFAESEVISLIAQNKPKGDIIRGLHEAVVNRVWNMVQMVGVHGAVTMSGGVAKNRGIVSLMEEKIGRKVNIYREPQIIGALGAAIIAKRAKK